VKDEEVVEIDAIRISVHEIHHSTESAESNCVIAGRNLVFYVLRRKLNCL